MSNYDIVREKCIEANPEIENELCACCQRIGKYDKFERQLRLADVLLAIQFTRVSLAFYGNDRLWLVCQDSRDVGKPNATWHFRHDSLEWHRDNAPMVIEWLAELLTTNNKDHGTT